MLYWKEHKYVLKVVRRGNIKIFVQSKLFGLEISIWLVPLMSVFQELRFWKLSLNGDHG